MHYRFTKALYPVCFLIAFLGLSGCTLDEPANGDQSPALTLQATQNLSVINLAWDRVQVTGFKEYILLQSTSDIPDNPTPPVGADITVVKRIQEVDITSFNVSPSLFSSQMCYKLYCAVDDRFLYSPTVCVNQDLTLLSGFYDVACHETGSKDMALFDRVNDRMSTFNYENEILTFGAAEITLNFPSMEMSTWNQTTFVFATEQNGLLRRYTFPSMSFSQTKTFLYTVWATNAHEELLFLVTDEPGKGFQVLNRNTLNVLAVVSGYMGPQVIAVCVGEPPTVLVLGFTNSKKYTVNESGSILSQENIPATLPNVSQQNICAEGKELFIGGTRGTIINQAGENVGTLTFSSNSFIQMARLSEDDKTAVYIINDNGNTHLQYADLSALPAVIVTETFDIPALNLADIIIDENVVYVIGATFVNNGETFILKYPISQ